MADDTGYWTRARDDEASGVSLADALDDAGRIVAVCRVFACGRRAVFKPDHWLKMGLGDLPLRHFEGRMRCLCGGRQVTLGSRVGDLRRGESGGLYVFR